RTDRRPARRGAGGPYRHGLPGFRGPALLLGRDAGDRLWARAHRGRPGGDGVARARGAVGRRVAPLRGTPPPHPLPWPHAIAGLLALRPPILVLDEPATDLDPVGRSDVFAVLAGLRRERIAILLIEHDAGAAVAADHLLLLSEGRVVASGRPREVLADVSRC